MKDLEHRKNKECSRSKDDAVGKMEKAGGGVNEGEGYCICNYECSCNYAIYEKLYMNYAQLRESPRSW